MITWPSGTILVKKVGEDEDFIEEALDPSDISAATQSSLVTVSGLTHANTVDISNLESYVDAQDSTLSGSIDTNTSSIATLSGHTDSTFVGKSGDSMTGPLTLSSNPTSNNHATTKEYVDDELTTTSGAIIGGISFVEEWRYVAGLTDTDPGTGNFSINSSSHKDATYLYIDDVSKQGIDFGISISRLTTGDLIFIQNKKKCSESLLFEVAGDSVDGSGYWKVPVSSGTGTVDITNDMYCGITVQHTAIKRTTKVEDLIQVLFTTGTDLDVTQSQLPIQSTANENPGNMFTINSNNITCSLKGLYEVIWNVEGKRGSGGPSRKNLRSNIVLNGASQVGSVCSGYIRDATNNHVSVGTSIIVRTSEANQTVGIRTRQTGTSGSPTFTLSSGHMLIRYLGS